MVLTGQVEVLSGRPLPFTLALSSPPPPCRTQPPQSVHFACTSITWEFLGTAVSSPSLVLLNQTLHFHKIPR